MEPLSGISFTSIYRMYRVVKICLSLSQERRGAEQAAFRCDHRTRRSPPQHPERSASQEVGEGSRRQGEISVAGVLKRKRLVNDPGQEMLKFQVQTSHHLIVKMKTVTLNPIKRTCSAR